MEVNQHMVGIEIPSIHPQYHDHNGQNGYYTNNNEINETSLDYYNLEPKFVCNLTADLIPNPNPSYNPFRVFVVDSCCTFEHGLNYIIDRRFVRFFSSLPYGFVIVLKCAESSLKNEASILIKLNSHYGTKKPLIVSFETDGANRIFYKNHGENCRFSEVLNDYATATEVTDFGSLMLNLESVEFGYFCGIFEEITLNKSKQNEKSTHKTIEKLMDIFARRKDLLGIRFLHLFNPQLKPCFDLIKGILNLDYNNTRDADFDGFSAIFDYNIADRTKSSSASQALDGFDCHLITNFTFKNNDNLLTLAVNKRNFEAVQFFISCGINVNLTNFDKELPADIAFKLGLYDILLLLLHANSMFPRLFSKPLNCPTELSNLVDLSTQLHELIKKINEGYSNGIAEISKNDLEAIDDIINRHPHLDYWYNIANESAATKAICSKKFGTYNFLLRSGLFVGPYEDIASIKEKLSEDEQHKIRVINAASAQTIPKDYLLVLRLNSYMWQNKKFRKAHSDLIEDAFNILDKKPEIQPILEIVAAAKNFRIIFDFNHSHVETLDFTSSKATSAVFHLRQSHIYIGAQDLLDNNNKHTTIATLGHELSHFAMLLTYENLCNPYGKYDATKQAMFKKVHSDCFKEIEKEYLIWLVYKYKEPRQHAELIVRAPHMIIHYINDDKTLKILEKIYPSLFEYYKKHVLNDVKDKIANVNQQLCENIKFEHEFWEKKRKKQKIIKYSFISGLFLAMIGFFLILLSQFEPCLNFNGITCKWESLKESTRERLLDLNATFNGNSVNLRELTRKYPQILTFLTNEQIRNIRGIEINPQDLELPFRYYERSFTKYDEDYYYHNETCRYKYNLKYDLETYEAIPRYRKIHLISNDPVAGTSTTFKYTAAQKRFEDTEVWVDYLDLQGFNVEKYTNLANWTSSDLTNFLIDVHNHGRKAKDEGIKPESFELAIFKQKLASGDVTLFIDHIDKIFMDNETFADIFLKTLFKMSNNKTELWIGSRNWFGERIEKIISQFDPKFEGRFKLLPMHCEDRDEFFSQAYAEAATSADEVSLLRDRMTVILKLAESWRNWQKIKIDNICLLKIMISHTQKAVRNNVKDVNFYDILKNYTAKIMELKTPDHLNDKASRIAHDRFLSAVALRYVELNYGESLRHVNLTFLIEDQIMSINYDEMNNNTFEIYGHNGALWNLKDETISNDLKRGILKVDKGNISFLHLINLEYYLANYVQNIMWHKDHRTDTGEIAIQKLLLLFNIFKDLNTQFPVVQRCIIDKVKQIQADRRYRRSYDAEFKKLFKVLYDDYLNSTNINVGAHLIKVFDDDKEMKEIIEESGRIQRENNKRIAEEKRSTSSVPTVITQP